MIKIDTVLLKDILSKMSKSLGNDKNVPITQLMHIYTQGNKIIFLTTDEINALQYTYTDETIESFDSINVAVLAEPFIKLISKFSSKDTEIGLSDSGNEIKIVGNGDYVLSLPLDSEGKPINFPLLPMIKTANNTTLDESTIYYGDPSAIISAAKYAEAAITKLTVDLQVEDYPRTNYYFGKIGCVTLDGYKATWVENSAFTFEALIYPSTIKLLSIFNSDDFKACKLDDIMLFECDGMKLYSKCAQGIDAFPFEVATSLLSKTFNTSVAVAASGFASALDRLKLFINSYDENCIKLIFNENGMFAKTISGNCVEQIAADKLTNNFECVIDIDNLMSQLKCLGDAVVHFNYGDSEIVQLISDDVKQLVVLCNDEDN